MHFEVKTILKNNRNHTTTKHFSTCFFTAYKPQP